MSSTAVAVADGPVPVGTVVEYFGSLYRRHGRYVVAAHENPATHPYRRDTEILRAAYPDGTAYVLYPVGVERSLDNQHLGMGFVRRGSFRVIEEGTCE